MSSGFLGARNTEDLQKLARAQGFGGLRWFRATVVTLLEKKAPYPCELLKQLFSANIHAMPALKPEVFPYRLHQAPRITPFHAAVKYIANGLFEVLRMAACFLAMNQVAHSNAPNCC